MLHCIYPFIISQRTSVGCTKFFFTALRQHGSKQYKTSKQALLLSSTTSTNVALKYDSKTNPAVTTKEVNDNNTELQQETIASLKSTISEIHEDTQVHSKHKSPVYKHISKPEVIAPIINKIDNAGNINSEPLKILNVIKSKDLEWHKLTLDLKLLAGYYMSLAKIRLTGLVVLTTLAGYGMAPGPIDGFTLICALVGTGLTSAAANAINQFLEVPYDSQMVRTKNRVLIRGLLTPLHVFTFAVCSATLGISMLYFCTNPLTMGLGITNLVLYTSVYTPLKRCSILNTWVGSVVGAIPPLIGWTACTGSLSSGALLMGAILYSWQFPHFNALSWNLRADYSRAGYRMTAVVNPQLCRSAALRHSIAIFLFCCASPLFDLTTWTFAIDSIPLNSYLIYRAYKFYKNSDSQTSRSLFRLSLIHLPALMLLMFVGKKHVNSDKNKKDNL